MYGAGKRPRSQLLFGIPAKGSRSMKNPFPLRKERRVGYPSLNYLILFILLPRTRYVDLAISTMGISLMLSV